MRRLAIAFSLPLFAVAILALWSCLACITLTFGVAPYHYTLETTRGTLTFERTFGCLTAEWPRPALGPARAFDRAFYDDWHRASSHEERFGVFSCDISYVISREAELLEPDLVVTPSTLVAIPHWILFGTTPAPLLLWLISRRHLPNRKKATPSSVPARTSATSPAQAPLAPAALEAQV